MITKEAFRQGMRRLGGAVTLITTGSAEAPAGLTATAVTSLSAEPPRLLTCINRQGQTYDSLQDCLALTVNVLSADDKDLAGRFGGLDGTPEEKRFEMGDWQTSGLGPLYLKTALVSFVCRVSEVHVSTTHGIVIGDIAEVILASGQTGPALGYIEGGWTSFAPLP